MARIVIIGAGDVGSTLAYTLQIAGLVEEIVLIDSDAERARGEAMDMNHGLFFVPPVKIYAGDYNDCRDAAVVVITAGVRQQPDETRLALAARNAEVCRSITDQIMAQTDRALLLIVTNPVDLMTNIVLKHCRLPREQVFGSGTVLDSARFRYELSHLCCVDPRNVHAYVIGEHGDSQVLLWHHVRIGSTPLAQFYDDMRLEGDRIREQVSDTVRNSAYHVIAAKGSTRYGIGLSLLRILSAIIRNENSLLTVSTALSGEYGLRDVCLSVPCIVGRDGIRKIVEISLTPQEREGLHTSARLLQNIQMTL
jgi:L-lactate dehydrogenase